MLSKEMKQSVNTELIEGLLRDYFKKPSIMHDLLKENLRASLKIAGFYVLQLGDREEIFYKIKYES